MGGRRRSAKEEERLRAGWEASPRLAQGAIPADAVQDDRKGDEGAGRAQNERPHRQGHDPWTALGEKIEKVAPRLSFQPRQAHLRSREKRSEPGGGGVDR